MRLLTLVAIHCRRVHYYCAEQCSCQPCISTITDSLSIRKNTGIRGHTEWLLLVVLTPQSQNQEQTYEEDRSAGHLFGRLACIHSQRGRLLVPKRRDRATGGRLLPIGVWSPLFVGWDHRRGTPRNPANGAPART